MAARAFAAALLAGLLLSALPVLALRWLAPPVTAMMLEQPGPVGDLDYEWVDRASISVAAARAVIAAEDQRFFEHHGLDFQSIERALDEHEAGDDLRGASTITQQVAKNLFLWPGRSFVRKGLEAYFALLIEALLPKQRILEIYLNVAELGPGVFGVEAAARRYFGTSAARLTASEAALLAAVLPNPRRLSAERPSAYVRGRQAWVLGQMTLLETRGHYRALAW
ncbi:MAG TPA: monofunctional biosynthetic peptidoglycan transglycosylase [Gammaproteobacteria bacterium]|nr:monofunctional biosynthetic peptidoglycan transglycosylase [Gammaproteobacteria bacterium]